jgi:hypothetical protein
MNRLVRGSVILAAAAVSWACGGLDTDGIDATAELVADPSVVFVANTDSQAVFVEALNDLGQQLEGNFELSNVGAGLVVNLDTTFAPRPGVENLPTRVRYFVKASSLTSFVNSSFTVTANGQSLVVPVLITPDTLPGVTLSNGSPALGDTVQVTAPPGIRFTNETGITTPGDTTRRVVNAGISADSTVLFILGGPGITAQALRFTNVQVTYNPGVNFTLNTDAVLTTPSLTTIPASFAPSNTTPNTPIVVTAPNFKFFPTATATVGGLRAAVIGPTADSNSISIVPFPGVTGPVTFSNVALSFLTSVPITGIPSVNTVTVSAALTPLTNTDDPIAAETILLPASGELVIHDVGSFGSGDLIGGGGDMQFIRFTLPTTRTLRITVNWNNSSDIDFFMADGGFNNFVGSTSASATGAQPETQAVTDMPAGTYILMLVNFGNGPIPPFVQVHFE